MSSLILDHHDQNPQYSKKRKVIEKKVLKAKNMEGNVEKVKGEFPPNDSWSWRKYGQKPIKGSPYPRSYYRCSSSKGCLAKKQVEKCKEDASVLIITYTSNHTHPGAKKPQTCARAHAQAQAQVRENQSHPMCPKQDQQQHSNDDNDRDEYTPSQERVNVDFDVKPTPPSPKQEEEAITLEDDSCPATLGNVLAADQCLRRMSSSPSENEENNGFYDELEELPTSYVSSFYSFMRFDEGILVLPS